MSSKEKVASVLAMVVILALTSVTTFIWSAATRWMDSTGIAVSVIFIGLSAIQITLSIIWWRNYSANRSALED